MKFIKKEYRDFEKNTIRKLTNTSWMEPNWAGRSLLPYLQDQDGRYSEEKTRRFINQIIQSLHKGRYWDHYEYTLLWGEKFCEFPAGQPTLTEDDIRFYRSLLYCALRVSAARADWLESSTGTFQDLCDLETAPENLRCETAEVLHLQELYGLGGAPAGFFGDMDRLYELFTGQNITSTISEKDVRKARESRKGELEAHEHLCAELSAESAQNESAQSLIPEDWGTAVTEERRQWAKHFPYQEALCQQYLICRELYFPHFLSLRCKSHPMSFNKLRRALAIFLLEEDQGLPAESP